MTDNEPKLTIKLELPLEEQQTIPQCCKKHSDKNRSKIEASSDEIVMLSGVDADILVEELHWVIPATRDEKVKTILTEVANRIPVGPEMVKAIGQSTKGGCSQ